MTPLFPRSGPGESGSPMSAVILRCYDFPARIPGHLFVSLPGSTLPSSVRVSQLALALPEGRGGAFRAGVHVQPATRLPGCSPPCTDRTGTPQPSGTFTTRLSTDRFPSPLLVMTTTVTGLLLLAGLSSAGMAASFAARPKAATCPVCLRHQF